MYSAYGTGVPTSSGATYSATNGTAPTVDPHTIQRSWRRAVTDRRRRSARIISSRPPSRQTAR